MEEDTMPPKKIQSRRGREEKKGNNQKRME
jgi:hypothetical protein